MRKIGIFLCMTIFLLSISSCNDLLDIEPLNQYSDGVVWNEDPDLIQSFINNIYIGLGQSGIRVMLSTYVDETMLTFGWGTDNVTKSLIAPNNYDRFNNTADQSGFFVWENIYSRIRACNLFFEKIEVSKAVDDIQKEKLKGEVYFLRAYLYQMLLSMYGSFPIIDKAYKLNDDFLVSRNTFEECVNFIARDYDKAIERIGSVTDKSKPTVGAALALKARLLLHAASDLYNSNASWAGSYSNPEYVGYVGGNQRARWQAAKDAAKAVIDLNQYSLHKENPQPNSDIAQNYAEIFLLKSTSEDIFVKYYTPAIVASKVMPNLNNGPNGWHLRGGNTPIGQMVDSYEMADGTKFNWTNPIHAAKPYENRDPRFYASILYDGAKWRVRPDDLKHIDPIGIVQTSFVEKWDSKTNSVVVIPGLDTRNSPTDDWNGSYTGYNLRKGCDPTIDAAFVPQTNPFRFVRYSEVLLNYAEACIELDEYDEAKLYLNKIRKRAGMPPFTETGQALKERYRNERRIELAFEDHRFFDVRRWMIAPQVYNNAQGIRIVHKLNSDKVTTTANYTVLPSVQQRAWKNSFYFIPIKLDEINRNEKLVQNPLY